MQVAVGLGHKWLIARRRKLCSHSSDCSSCSHSTFHQLSSPLSSSSTCFSPCHSYLCVTTFVIFYFHAVSRWFFIMTCLFFRIPHHTHCSSSPLINAHLFLLIAQLFLLIQQLFLLISYLFLLIPNYSNSFLTYSSSLHNCSSSLSRIFSSLFLQFFHSSLSSPPHQSFSPFAS